MSRSYFLKHPTRSGLPSSHSLHFYVTVIRPILEYASPLWHPTLTKSQAELLEAVQRRAINSIFGDPPFTCYVVTLALAGIPSLRARRLDLSKRFFSEKNCQPTSCLHHLLPPLRDPAVTSRLWKPTLHPRTSLRTKRYCSTVMYGLVSWLSSSISCVWFYIHLCSICSTVCLSFALYFVVYLCIVIINQSINLYLYQAIRAHSS